MKTATQSIIELDTDMYAAKRFADTILHLLSDHISDASRRDVWDLLARTAYEQKFELTTFEMRKQYEAWKSTQIDMLNLSHGQIAGDGK